jgi:hypothetical protein
MIIHLDPSAFCCEVQVRKRLEVLERGLRRASDGGMKLSDYAAWLKASGLAVPSRQTLRADLERYVQHCDDLVYGDRQKSLTLDVHAGRDAIRYFLGEPWLASPLKPKLSSSVCRCLLLAMHLREKVEFQYAALPQPGLAPTFKTHRGVPLRTLPGSDSGYMALWLEQGIVMPINLTRVRGRVAFTGRDISHYRPPPVDPEVILSVRSGNLQSLERCARQFDGSLEGGREIRFPMPASLALMSADLLEGWWRRTSAVPRRAERTIELPDGAVTIYVQPKEQ